MAKHDDRKHEIQHAACLAGAVRSAQSIGTRVRPAVDQHAAFRREPYYEHIRMGIFSSIKDAIFGKQAKRRTPAGRN